MFIQAFWYCPRWSTYMCSTSNYSQDYIKMQFQIYEELQSLFQYPMKQTQIIVLKFSQAACPKLTSRDRTWTTRKQKLWIPIYTKHCRLVILDRFYLKNLTVVNVVLSGNINFFFGFNDSVCRWFECLEYSSFNRHVPSL